MVQKEHLLYNHKEVFNKRKLRIYVYIEQVIRRALSIRYLPYEQIDIMLAGSNLKQLVCPETCF
jgi:hypothetical protein